MAAKRPFFVIVPGGSQNPAQYGYLSHLLLEAGYPVITSLLPSVGGRGHVTVEDDANYIRDSLIVPVLDIEEHDVILILHSYSGVPGSAAALGLSKAERSAAGKKTGVIGQVFICAVVLKGGDGKTVFDAFGGTCPPHIRPDPEMNLFRCDERIEPLYKDITLEPLQDAAATASMAQCMTTFQSPCPRASWDSPGFKGRIAFVRTVNDNAVPFQAQAMMTEASGVSWTLKDIETGHSPQLANPTKLTEILLELVKDFEAV